MTKSRRTDGGGEGRVRETNTHLDEAGAVYVVELDKRRVHAACGEAVANLLAKLVATHSRGGSGAAAQLSAVHAHVARRPAQEKPARQAVPQRLAGDDDGGRCRGHGSASDASARRGVHVGGSQQGAAQNGSWRRARWEHRRARECHVTGHAREAPTSSVIRDGAAARPSRPCGAYDGGTAYGTDLSARPCAISPPWGAAAQLTMAKRRGIARFAVCSRF